MTDSHGGATISTHVAEAATAPGPAPVTTDPGAPALQRRHRHPRRGAARRRPAPGARRRGRPRGSSARRPRRWSRRSRPAGSTCSSSTARPSPLGGLGLCRAAEERDLRLPADPGAHRPPAGRLAGRLVAGRPRRAAPARPDRAGRGRRRPGSRARASPPGLDRAMTDADLGVAHTWPDRPHRAAGRQRPRHRAGRVGDGRDHGRRGHARRRSPGSSWRCGPRARRSRRCAASPT